MPPRLAATGLLLQADKKGDDAETKQRADFDIRWKVALDTTYILGRGVIRDTFNLLAGGIVQMVRTQAALAGTRHEEWALSRGLELRFGPGVEGEAAIDWDNAGQRRAPRQNFATAELFNRVLGPLLRVYPIPY